MFINNSGNVGIGTTNPLDVLHVYGGIRSSASASDWNNGDQLTWDYNAGNSRINARNSGGTATITLYTNSANRLKIDAAGYVGVVNLAGASANHICYDTTTISGYNTFSTCSSSARYKEDIAPLVVDKNRVFRLQPVSFKWKNRNEWDVGLIAEDVEKLIPELVTYKNGTVEGVKYDQLTVYLLDIMKRQDNDIGNLKAENSALKQLVCLDHPDAVEVCR